MRPGKCVPKTSHNYGAGAELVLVLRSKCCFLYSKKFSIYQKLTKKVLLNEIFNY